MCMQSASDYAASNCNTRTNVEICHFCVQNLKLHWLQKLAFCPSVDYVVNRQDVSVFYVDTQKIVWSISRRYSCQSFHCHAHFVSTSQSWTMSFRFSLCWCKCLYERCYKPLQDPLQVTLISLFRKFMWILSLLIASISKQMLQISHSPKISTIEHVLGSLTRRSGGVTKCFERSRNLQSTAFIFMMVCLFSQTFG